MGKQSGCADETTAGVGRPFASLSFRDFRFLWLGVVTMMAGLQMQAVVRGYLTYDITASAFRLGLVNSGFAFPMLALTLFGGAMADRFRKKRIIQMCQGLGSVTAVFIGISISTGTVTWVHLLAASVINGFIFAFMVPARTALIPKLVEGSLVSNALALNAAAMSTTTLIAPAIGGALYAFIGPAGVYYLIAALELSAVVFTGLIGDDGGIGVPTGENIFRRILDGIVYIRKNPVLIILLVMGLSTALLVMPFRSLLPVLIVDEFHRGPETLGILLSTMGVGALIGSLTIAGLGRRRRGVILLAGGFMSAVGLLIAAMLPFFAVTMVVMLILGLSDSIRRSLNMALLLESTQDEYQGRVSSVYTMNFGLTPLGTLPAGAVAEHFGVPVTSLILGLILGGICILIVFLKPRLSRMQ